MLDWIASYLVRGLHVFFAIMPMSFNLWLGRRVGTLVYLTSGKRKHIAYANLKAAFAGEKSPKELNRIAKGVYVNMVECFTEIVSMTKVDEKYLDKYVNIHNLERIQELSKSPEGIIFISAHFGNWEFTSVASSIKGYPMYFLGRDQKMKRLNELINLYRESKGNTVIRKGTDVKTIIRVLHDGKIVGLAGDQNAGVNGQLLNVFGRLASVPIGPFRIAERTGAYILPAFIHRVKGKYHELYLEPPMKIEKGGDLIPYMEEYNRLLEKHISANPEQWLWMHKRWKMTPLKKIMILDDGKKGHLKQSLAVLKALKAFRKDEGFSPEETEVDIVEIHFKSQNARGVFNALSPFITAGVQGRLRLLRWALTKESYDNAVNRYADVIISCASTLFGVNKVLKLENFAKNITVLDPGPFMRKAFNMIVVPKHDAVKRGKALSGRDNVIVTDLAPNLIEPDELSSFKEEMDKRYGSEGKLKIGILMGGDNATFTISEELLRSLGKNVLETCEKEDGYIYMTTSRRTTYRSEKVIANIFTSHPRCRMMVSGESDTDEYTVEKILAVSDVIIVSGESISMVSEAVSAGKPVLVFMPDKMTDKITKYERFVNGLHESRHLRRIIPGDVPREISRIVEGKSTFSHQEDSNLIKQNMYRIF